MQQAVPCLSSENGTNLWVVVVSFLSSGLDTQDETEGGTQGKTVTSFQVKTKLFYCYGTGLLLQRHSGGAV